MPAGGAPRAHRPVGFRTAAPDMRHGPTHRPRDAQRGSGNTGDDAAPGITGGAIVGDGRPGAAIVGELTAGAAAPGVDPGAGLTGDCCLANSSRITARFFFASS